MLSFLEDLIGYKSVLVDGVALPQRAVISFEGDCVLVEDDPTNEQTIVTVMGDYAPGAVVEFVPPASGAWYLDTANIVYAGLVRLQPTDGVAVSGIDTTSMPRTARRKTLVNVGTDVFVLVHQSEDAPADDRFVFPDGVPVQVGPNGAIEVLWCEASDELPAGWRAADNRWISESHASTVFFVDSVDGDDEADGLSPVTPFQTLGRVEEELLSGQRVLLKCNSRFYEELTGWPTGVRVSSYGSGARPIIDGRERSENGDFSATGGYTNVYEIPWTHDFAADGGKSAHRVWEDGVMLTRAASVAACDATPGSFYAAAPTTAGPDTIYVHPSDSVHPIINGRDYDLTKRRWCVQLYNSYKQAHVTGLETIGNAYADGSLCIDGYVEDCVAKDGRIHNAFILGEAVSCQALRTEAGINSAMFVSYADVSGFGGPSARNVLYRDCLADAQSTMELVDGFYVHTDGVRMLGTIEYRDCRVVGCSGGWAGIQAAKFVAYRCTYDDVKTAYGLCATEGNYFLGGTGKTRAGFFTGGLMYLDSTAPDLTFVIHGCKIYAVGSFNQAFVSAPLSDVLIKRCTLVGTGSVGLNRGNITFQKCVTRGDMISTQLGTPSELPAVFDTDYNCYWSPPYSQGVFQKMYPSAAYVFSLADWRTYLASIDIGAAQDANSIEVDPLIADGAGLDFTLSNATVLAMGAGAEVDEEDDAELQAYWMTHRVTEV